MQIEGRNPVIEALSSNTQISRIYVQNKISRNNKVANIFKLANKKKIPLKIIGTHKLNQLSKTQNHQGVIAIVRYNYFNLKVTIQDLFEKNQDPFFVIIPDILHEQNLGAIIRSSECAGCNGVIISKKINLSSETVRTSMGATQHIPIIRENLFNALKTLKKNGIKIIGLEATGSKIIYDCDLRGPIAFIIGAEDKGITMSITPKCDIVLKIPLFGKISSLNMSNALSIALFEKVRQELKNN
jgi:23S rRNA (guanosine2251-2'-O)-methyltransferase